MGRTISEEINFIRDKYTPEHVKMLPNKNFCRNTYALSLGECQRCGWCGRVFDGNTHQLIKEGTKLNTAKKTEIDTRPVFDQLEEVYNKKKTKKF